MTPDRYEEVEFRIERLRKAIMFDSKLPPVASSEFDAILRLTASNARREQREKDAEIAEERVYIPDTASKSIVSYTIDVAEAIRNQADKEGV